MAFARKQGTSRRAHPWSTLACFLFLLAKALAVVPAMAPLPSAQGVVALRWQDQKPAWDAQAAIENRRAFVSASRMRTPADAGGHDLLLPAPVFVTAPEHDGVRLFPAPGAAPDPSPNTGFSARAPPATVG